MANRHTKIIFTNRFFFMTVWILANFFRINENYFLTGRGPSNRISRAMIR